MTPILYYGRYLPAGQSHPQDLGGGGSCHSGEGGYQNLPFIFSNCKLLGNCSKNLFLGLPEFCLPRLPIHAYTKFFLLTALSKYIDLVVYLCCRIT